MKWREGIFITCPFCDASRDGAGHREEIIKYLRSIARVHHYTCGCEVVENYTIKREFLQCSVTSTCAAGLLVLSKAMSAIVNKKSLDTWSSYKYHYDLARRSANVLSSIIHRSAMSFAQKNDVWRLPPIPQIRSLTAKEEYKRLTKPR